MSRISEINPAHAPEAIQKIITDHVSDGHALTAEKAHAASQCGGIQCGGGWLLYFNDILDVTPDKLV